MKKFVLGLVSGLLFIIVFEVIMVGAIFRMGSDRKVAIPDGSTLVMKVEGELPEASPVDIPVPFLDIQTQSTVADLWAMLRKASSDNRVKALILMPRGIAAGWGKMQELRESLVAFKKSGKPVYAFLRTPGTKEYYLATVADRIYVTPTDQLDLKGMRIEVMFLKGTFDKLGLQMEIEHAGKYKDAGDIYTRTAMTPETKESLNAILDQFYGHFVDTVAAARKKTPDQVRALFDDGPFLAEEAKANGLVDMLAFEDQMAADLAQRLKAGEIKRLSQQNYLKSAGKDGNAKKIALIVGQGEIHRGSGADGAGDGIYSASFNKILREVGEDGAIQGVILRVDSPGGDAVASDDILHEVQNLGRKKPMVISMSDLAASGGYFISMNGEKIIAYPNTLTGSIGVIAGRLNLKGFYDKIGISKDTLTRGKNAAMDSESRPLDESARAKLRSSIEATYRGFLKRVADGRHRKTEEIEPLAQGRVWAGAQAKQNGLVDELGGLTRAVELVKEKAKIDAKENVTLIAYPARRSLFDVLMSRNEEGNSVEAIAQSQIESQLFGRLPVRSLAEGGLMKLMPYSIDVR